MTSVRWIMLDEIKKAAPGVQVSVTYGVTTKRKRQELHLPKSHVNDAFSMASFHPKKRSDTEYWKRSRGMTVSFRDFTMPSTWTPGTAAKRKAVSCPMGVSAGTTKRIVRTCTGTVDTKCQRDTIPSAGVPAV